MPFPLLVPFLIKGGIIVGKVLLSKGTVAKGAAMATKTAVAKFGAAKTASFVAGALICTGGVAWTIENIERINKAHEHFSTGDYLSAAEELTRVAVSIKTVGTNDYAGNLQSWLANGRPLDETFVQLLKDGRALAVEAAATAKA